MTHPIQSRFLAIAAVVLVSGATPFAVAHEGGKHHQLPISLDALEARAAERFAATDTDGDGLVSSVEFNAMESPRREARGKRHHKRMMRHLDQSADPQTRRAEREAIRFDAIDTNDDGQISADEFSRRKASLKSAHKARLFARLDANADGQLDLDEFPSRLRHLKEFDADGDGQVTRAEMRAGAHRRHADT